MSMYDKYRTDIAMKPEASASLARAIFENAMDGLWDCIFSDLVEDGKADKRDRHRAMEVSLQHLAGKTIIVNFLGADDLAPQVCDVLNAGS